ncbi:FAD-dependent oxidoreductase [bacterium]|nr:FAD-dependent oxidoreductase [bacterium]
MNPKHFRTNQRVVIVGGVAGGASCAARLRRLSPSTEIILLERGPYASFANCGLPYYVGGVIAERDRLLVTPPEVLRERFRIDLRTRHEAVGIDRERRVVAIRNLESGECYEERYDALVLSPGAAPIRPPLPGIDLPGIFSVRTIPDVDAITAWIKQRHARRAVVVGGGFIGLEMVENLRHRGLSVALVEKLPQVMPPMDPEMMTPVHHHLFEKGVDLRLGDGVGGFRAGEHGGLVVCTEKGEELPAELVILSIGVRPETALARAAGLSLGERGGIRVDEYMQAAPGIYAVGDAVEVRDWVTGEWTLCPLAGPANRQGRLVADNIVFGNTRTYRGSQGTAVVGCFELTIASTGAGEKTLARLGRKYEKVYVHQAHHAGYYPGARTIHLKLLFDPSDGTILGAQAVGHVGVEKRIDVIALALQKRATVYDLEEAELCYAPQYGSAKDPVNIAGFIAVNHLRGLAPLAHWDEPRDGALILDVRTPGEVERGHVPGSVNIPLDELAERLSELPRGRDIRVHCGVGARSHLATRLLREAGLSARNLSGGFASYLMLPLRNE